MPPPYHLPEQKFVPGLDEGLKKWLRMRESLRATAEAHQGERIETISNGIRYRYHRYWSNQALPEFDKHSGDPVMSMVEFEELCKSNVLDALRYALKCSQSRHLRHVLPQIPNINQPLDSHDNTALHIAAYEGDREKVELLLTHEDIRVNRVNDRKMTALLHSMRVPVTGFHVQEIQNMLVKAGSKVNVASNRGTTPLHQACLMGNVNLIELFLKIRAQVFVLDNKGKTPMDYVPADCEEEVQGLFRKYLKKRGKTEHQRMWAHILSRQLVTAVFQVAEPFCIKCKRKIKDCQTLKLRDYRYWLLVHDRVRK